MPKDQPTHVTTDNSDGRQQILIALATTHHTFPKFSLYLKLLIVCKMRHLIRPLLYKTC